MSDRALNAGLALLSAAVVAASTVVAAKDRPVAPAAHGRLTVLATGDVWGEVEPCG